MTIAIRTIEVARREKLEEVREQDTHSTFGRFAICGVVRDETEVFGRSSHLVNTFPATFLTLWKTRERCHKVMSYLSCYILTGNRPNVL